ncbi:MAG TPA: hypothetical protein VL634_20210, partial [Mycobacterium sp.]|nr:hypothetical protein [Mycobacterium sp.]
VRIGFLSLKDQDEPVVVGQKRDSRRPSVRLQLKAKRLFEERDRMWDVSDLKIEMIEFHSEPPWARECPAGRGTSPRRD